VVTADRAWDRAWDRALELAWDGYCGGTTPVGAVVIDAAGVIVAEGRGRRYEPAGPPGQLAGSHVAHAEINALTQLGADRHYEDHALLTTLEPCGMCHGAAIQASVGSLAYAGSDPYAGTGHLDFGVPQTGHRPLRVTGPLPGERGRLAELLHLVFLLQRPAGPHVLAAQRSALPTRFAQAADPRTQHLITGHAATHAPLAALLTALRPLASPDS
jgi:tRNA(Arg) A34 adenosine deaminase TadA